MSDRLRPAWLRTLPSADQTPDGELARRFHTHGDADAFELLIRRHAPTVLRVCRAVVRDPHLAEDAAQAVFIIFARKAGTLAGVRSVSAWLIRVAYRAAHRARTRASAHPHAPLATAAAFAAPDPDPADAASAADLAAVVLEEVHRLPDRYHAPVVLCYLNGLTQIEAAARLGWPSGTVAGRLARARAVLRDRLSRRGVALPAAGVAAVLGPGTSAVAGGFVTRVLTAVAGTPDPVVSELTREVLKAMTPSLRPIARIAVALGLAVATTAVLLAAQEMPPPEKPPEKKVEKKPADPRFAFDEQLAKENKFVVVGKVVSADGKTPLEDVEVWASAGIGSLRVSGKTTTDKDGKFRLVFTAGLMLAGGKPGGVAIVGARKAGWHSWYYGWRPEYILSDTPLAEKDVSRGYTNLVPGKPSPLEFRMQPAASLRLKLVDGAGKPRAGTRVWLTGDRLPPGASVIADGRTDADGVFVVDDVPRSRYRLVIEPAAGSREELELGSIQFRDAAVYEAVATVHEWKPDATHVSLKVTRGRDR